ncbi:MAG TPA: type IV toxin-antitoxin system AbiEi family antitoxin domain-containing protein [Microlunatus sp.]
MHPRIDPGPELLALAAAQSGVISGAQAELLAFPRRAVDRLVAQRHWRRLTPGIFSIGPGEPSWHGLAWAGILLGGDRCRLGFEAAGHLWGLVENQPHPLTVLVPAARQVSSRGDWVVRRELDATRDPRSPGSPSRTTIEDTVVDLCRDADGGHVLDLVTRAVQTRRTNARRILDCVDRRERISHRRLLRDILGDVSVGAQSALELRYLREVERPHGLPTATRQVRARRGGAYRDVRYDEFATIVELDGEIHARQRLRDSRRDNAALLEGELTLRYGWADVTERPCLVAWEVAALLTARGWSGQPTRCPRCRAADLWSW